jgi:AraC-like DNA-binding protein
MVDLWERFPAWMPATYHAYHVQLLLETLVRIPCSVAPVLPDAYWIIIKAPDGAAESMMWWETRLGHQKHRQLHNAECFAKVKRQRATLVADFRGLADVYVPVVRRGRCEAIIAAGPFLTRPLGASDILQQWAELGAGPPDPYDRDLAAYARTALGLQLLEPHELTAFRELLEMLARAFVGEGDAAAEIERVAYLRSNVFARMVSSRMRKGQQALGAISNAAWGDTVQAYDREELGLEHVPNTVIAVMPDEPEQRQGVVAELVAAHSFQRRAAEISSRLPDTLAAQLDDYGAYFAFFSSPGRHSGQRSASLHGRARAIVERVERETGRRVTVGVGGTAEHSAGLPECARRAALALQLAAHGGERWLPYGSSIEQDRAAGSFSTPAACLLRLLRAFSTHRWREVDALQADYVRAALVDGGGRISRIRLHLEYALGGLIDELEAGRVTDGKTLGDLRAGLRDSLDRAASSTALVNAFRDAISLLVRARSTPKRGSVELRLARAARFISDRCGEPITRASVARRVGLSPSYFSVQFKAALGLGFEEYLRGQRIERAKQLLQRSSLSMQEVAHGSGFVSVTHFNRVFRGAMGETPSAHRAKFRPPAERDR